MAVKSLVVALLFIFQPSYHFPGTGFHPICTTSASNETKLTQNGTTRFTNSTILTPSSPTKIPRVKKSESNHLKSLPLSPCPPRASLPPPSLASGRGKRSSRPTGPASPRPRRLAPLQEGRDASLGRVLVAVVERDLPKCSLVLAAHHTFNTNKLVPALAELRNTIQVVEVGDETNGEEVGRKVAWKGGIECTAYLLLLHNPAPLLSLSTTPTSLWDTKGRYVVAGLTKGQLEELSSTFKGRKTEHVVGLVQGESEGEWEVYMNQLYWGPGMARVTAWRTGRFTSSATFFPDKTTDLRGAKLNVATFEYRPSTIYYRTANNSVAFLYGRDVEIVKAVAPVLNFTVNFIEPPNGEKWGTLRADGTWTGLVGTLARGEAELAIANLFVSSMLGRDQFQGYSTLFDSEEVKFLIRTEPPLPRWQSPGLPFTRDTWLAIVLGLIILAPVICVIARAGSTRSASGQEPGTLRSLVMAYMFTISLHLREPHPANPRSHSSRLLIAVTLLYTLVLSLSYSCNLTAFLTITRRPTGMQTLLELYESKLLLYENSYYIRDQLKTSPTPYLRELANAHTLVKDISEAAPGVKRGLGVFITNIGNMDFLFNTVVAPSQGGYGVHMIKESLVTYSLAIGTPSQSPLKFHLDRAVSRVFEAGLCKIWKQVSYVLYRKNKRELGGEEESVLADTMRGDDAPLAALIPLTLDHLQTAFYILGFICFLATLVFVTEVLVLGRGYTD